MTINSYLTRLIPEDEYQIFFKYKERNYSLKLIYLGKYTFKKREKIYYCFGVKKSYLLNYFPINTVNEVFFTISSNDEFEEHELVDQVYKHIVKKYFNEKYCFICLCTENIKDINNIISLINKILNELI